MIFSTTISPSQKNCYKDYRTYPLISIYPITRLYFYFPSVFSIVPCCIAQYSLFIYSEPFEWRLAWNPRSSCMSHQDTNCSNQHNSSMNCMSRDLPVKNNGTIRMAQNYIFLLIASPKTPSSLEWVVRIYSLLRLLRFIVTTKGTARGLPGHVRAEGALKIVYI